MGVKTPNSQCGLTELPCLECECFARQVDIPFYRSKGMTYNAWLMGAYTVHFLGLLPLPG
jgi:hypothetical protein